MTRPSYWGCACAVAATLAACGGDATQLLVVIEADPGVAALAHTIDVQAAGSREAHHVFGVDAALDWPVTVAIAPADPDRERRVDVSVVARDARGGAVTGAVVHGAYALGRTRTLVVRLADCCVGRTPCVEASVGAGEAPPILPACATETPPSAPPAEAPLLRYPWNGAATGSPYGETSLRPTFRWEGVRGASRYEVELDAGCDAGAHETCAFEAPIALASVATSARPATPLEVSREVPSGRRYAWRVRACNAAGCGPVSTARYLDVGRQVGDLDGDGLAEVVAGAPRARDGAGIERGAVLVVRGALGGVAAASATARLGAYPEPGARFGDALATGDIDADGRAELLVGAPLADLGQEDAGAVLVLRAERDGLTEVAQLAPAEPHGAGRFGAAVAAAGDLNGDGFGDVVIGAPGEGGGEGRVHVYLGSAAGLAASSAVIGPGEGRGLRAFGRRVRGIGDMNGDGLVDLAVSAELGDEWGGALVVLLGDATRGVSDAPAIVYANHDGRMHDGLGDSVGGGDLDADGYSDLLVGSPALNEGRGVAFVYFGGRMGLPTGASTTLTNPQARAGGLFGASVDVIDDGDGDGYAELLVGALGNTDRGVAGAGLVHSFQGASARPPEMTASDATELGPTAPQSTAAFGGALACVGDVDGDGIADLAVGAPGWDGDAADEGRVFLFSSAGGEGAAGVVEVAMPVAQEHAALGVLP